MKQRFRLWWFLPILALVIAGWYLVKKTQPISLKIGIFSGSNWGVPDADSYDLLDQAIKSFQTQHPDVKITYETGIRKEQYEEWLAQKIMKDEIPDILFVPSEQFMTLANNGTLQDLTNRIEKDKLPLRKYYTASLEEGKKGNRYYALPYQAVPELMFVNKTLLEKEGISLPPDDWTWEDFYKIVKKVTKDTDHDGKIDQFGVYGYSWEQAVYSNGASIYNEQRKQVQLDQTNIVEAISFMRKLHNVYDEKMESEAFDKGKVAFCPMDYATYRTYMPYPWRVKKYSSFAWDSIPLPKGPHGKNTSIIDTLMVGMSSRSNHKDMAWEFMKYISSDTSYQKELAIQSEGVSVLPVVMQDKKVIQTLKKDNPGESNFEMKSLDTVMKQGIAIRNTEEYNLVMKTANAEIAELLENDQDIENRMIRLQREINAMLRK